MRRRKPRSKAHNGSPSTPHCLQSPMSCMTSPYVTERHTPRSSISPACIKLAKESIQKHKTIKEAQAAAEQQKQRLRTEHNQKLRQFNQKIRQKNACGAKPKKPRAIDPKLEELRQTQEKLRNKRRVERARALSAGRHRIGLGNLKIKKKTRPAEPPAVIPVKKEYKPKSDMLQFMKKQRLKRKQQQIEECQSIEAKELQRAYELRKLQHMQKPKKSLKKLRKETKRTESPPIINAESLESSDEELKRKREELKGKFIVLNERVQVVRRYTGALKVQAAARGFRARHQLLSLKEEKENQPLSSTHSLAKWDSQKEKLQELMKEDFIELERMQGSDPQLITQFKEMIEKRYRKIYGLFGDLPVEHPDPSLSEIEPLDSSSHHQWQESASFNEITSESFSSVHFEETSWKCSVHSSEEPSVPSINSSSSAESDFTQELLSKDLLRPSLPASISDPEEVLRLLELILQEAYKEAEAFRSRLATGISIDPCTALRALQEYELGRPSLYQLKDFQILGTQVLKLLQKTCSSESELVFMKCMYDSVDEAFQLCRKYAHGHEPFPWQSTERAVGRKPDLNVAVNKVKEALEEWAYMQAGKILPTDLLTEVNEELLYHIREEKLANMLALEVMDTDTIWVTYTYEADQVTLDAAELILEQLLGEVVDLF